VAEVQDRTTAQACCNGQAKQESHRWQQPTGRQQSKLQQQGSRTHRILLLIEAVRLNRSQGLLRKRDVVAIVNSAGFVRRDTKAHRSLKRTVHLKRPAAFRNLSEPYQLRRQMHDDRNLPCAQHCGSVRTIRTNDMARHGNMASCCSLT
jgi:hypothetical protein